MADGTPYKIELLLTIDIEVRSFGALNHSARYKNRRKRVVIPRSARAAYYHRLVSLLKLLFIVLFLIFFPVDSVLWRFMAGLLGGGIVSTVVLKLFRVRSKTSYLLTPGLIVKMAIWIFSLDMLFDLVIGIFPFYRKMFRPVIKQGITLDSLYKEGYQNYQELPVYSVMYPLIRWLF